LHKNQSQTNDLGNKLSCKSYGVQVLMNGCRSIFIVIFVFIKT